MIDEDSEDNDIFIRDTDDDEVYEDMGDELDMGDFGFDFETSEDDYD